MLKTQVQMLKGIGPKKAMRLERMGIRTLGDVLEFYPRSYIDKRKIHSFADVEDELTGTFLCHVISATSTRSFGRNKAMLKVRVQDEAQKAELVFFNAAYLKDKYQAGNHHLLIQKYCKGNFTGLRLDIIDGVTHDCQIDSVQALV